MPQRVDGHSHGIVGANTSIQLDRDFKALAHDIERLLGQWKPRTTNERHGKVRASLWLQRLRTSQCGRQVPLQRTRNDYALLLKQGCVTGHFLTPLDKAPSNEDLAPLQRHVVWSLKRWEKVEALLDPAGRNKTSTTRNSMAPDDNIPRDTESVIAGFLEKVHQKLRRDVRVERKDRAGYNDRGYGSSPNTERNSRKRTPDKSEDLALRGLQSLTCHAPRNHIYLAVVPRENCSGLVEENQVLKEQLRDAQHRVSLLERQLQRYLRDYRPDQTGDVSVDI